MKFESVHYPEAGFCRVTFTAGAQELEQALAAGQAGAPSGSPDQEEDLLAAAVNRAILAGFSPLYEAVVGQEGLIPVTDPDFSLLAINRSEGFRAEAEFFVLPRELELGQYTGFVQAIEPHPIRQLTLELEINQRHSAENRAADAEGKAALRRRVARELYQKRCAQARTLAEQTLIYQLGAEVRGPLPKQLVAGNYFAEQRRFNLSLQGRGVNFDDYLKVRGQTVEEFRQELHAEAEQRLRSRLGLLLVAGKEGFWPTDAEVEQGLAAWNEKRDGARTFAANDARKVRQRLAAGRAAQYILAHSTLIPPPPEPVILTPEETRGQGQK